MKKIFLLFMFLAITCGTKLYAGFSPRDYQLWRSTEISGTLANFVIATGAVIVADILVTSGTVASISQFQYRNSSSAAVGVFGSTSTVYDVDTTADYFVVGEQCGDGLVGTKTGSSVIRVRWNWAIVPPAGQEYLGLKD